jgi:fatty-acyl-CoA synthase
VLQKRLTTTEVVGVPDEKHGYVGAAFIQLHDDTPENREHAEEYSRVHLAKFQVPKYFIYMAEEDWPRTSSGKVQKFRLKEMAAALQKGTIKNRTSEPGL